MLLWGKTIIEGEQARIAQGGFPIYNPAINKVQVHYDIFREHYNTHIVHKRTHSRVYEDTELMRKTVDALILDIWDQVEAFYRDEYPYAKLVKCQAYGMIYYYRTGEAHLTPEGDLILQKRNNQQTKLQWSDLD